MTIATLIKEYILFGLAYSSDVQFFIVESVAASSQTWYWRERQELYIWIHRKQEESETH